MSQHHFVVCYDSEHDIWSFDFEAKSRFPEGTIWVSDSSHEDGGYWTKYDDSHADPEITKIADTEDMALGTLVGMLMLKNDHYQLKSFPRES